MGHHIRLRHYISMKRRPMAVRQLTPRQVNPTIGQSLWESTLSLPLATGVIHRVGSCWRSVDHTRLCNLRILMRLYYEEKLMTNSLKYSVWEATLSETLTP
eukprot:4424775-Amphidinium_carterae.1